MLYGQNKQHVPFLCPFDVLVMESVTALCHRPSLNCRIKVGVAFIFLLKWGETDLGVASVRLHFCLFFLPVIIQDYCVVLLSPMELDTTMRMILQVPIWVSLARNAATNKLEIVHICIMWNENFFSIYYRPKG